MTVIVSDTGKRNTHHLRLWNVVDMTTIELGLNLCQADGTLNEKMMQRDPIPGSVLKVMSGEEQYSDHVPPWRDVAQKDWSGGRGMEVFDDDPTRYFDDHRMNTTQAGEMSPWGLESWSKGIRNRHVAGIGWYGFGTVDDDARSNYWQVNVDYNNPSTPVIGRRYWAQKFTPSPGFTARYIFFYIRKIGSPSSLTINLHSDDAGKPGAVLETITLPDTDLEYPYCWYLRRVIIPARALTGGTQYWISWVAGSNSSGTYWQIGTMTSGWNEPTSSCSPDGTTWTHGQYPIYLCITEENAPARMHHATLKGLDYIGVEYLDGTVSKVYKNGTGGTATSATGTTLVDTNNADLTDDRFNHCICMIVAGRGSDAAQPWRKITDLVGATYTLTVAPAWEITPDATSEYVISGSNEWIEVTGHGLGAGEQIKCALAVNGAIYYGCGDGVDMIRLRRYWATATYAQWRDDTGNRATLLKALATNGNMQVWKGSRGRPSTIARADTAGLDCTGTGAVGSLVFNTAINCGNLDERINGLAVAGDSYPTLYVLKEGSIYKVENDIPQELRVSEFQTVRDPINGYASLVKGSYLYFNHGAGVERYYRNTLESVGPNLDAGLPHDRAGYICQMINYKGMLVMCVDGGADNYSSIVVYSGSGYCEMWRGPAVGMRILNGWVQPMPGNNVDRLWFNCQGNLLWLPIHGNLAKVNKYVWQGAGYTSVQTDIYYYWVNFARGAHIITGWFYLGLRLLNKLFNAIQVIQEQEQGYGTGNIGLAYQLDDFPSWSLVSLDIGDYYADTPLTSLTSSDVISRRIRFLLTWDYLSRNLGSKVLALVLEALAIGAQRYRDTFTVKIADNDMQLDGRTPDDIPTAAAKLALLKTWIEGAGTVTINCFDPELDGKRLKLDSMPIRILNHFQDDLRNEYIVQFGAYEVD